jgi:hypothetical protein
VERWALRRLAASCFLVTVLGGVMGHVSWDWGKVKGARHNCEKWVRLTKKGRTGLWRVAAHGTVVELLPGIMGGSIAQMF